MVRDSDVADSTLIRESAVNVLIVEDNAAELRLLHEFLKHSVRGQFCLVSAKRMSEAIACLKTKSFEVVLLDLTLPDSAGLDSLDAIIHESPNLPIVVLTNTNDDELAVRAVRHGAQDYLVKRQLNPELLIRSIRYAIERKQASVALREANEILEERVRERTIELETAHRRLQEEFDRCQKIQERLELAQKAGKTGTFEWNLQTNVFTWTSELEALYGLSSNSFSGRYEDWIDKIHSDDRARVEQELRQAIAYHRGLDIEFRILHPDQSIHWIAVKSSVFEDGEQAFQMLGIHIDITEKKQLEAQFLHAQRLESIGTLAGGVAHDLNNILTPILAVVQLLPLKVPDLSDQNRQLLKLAESSARRGAELIKQILSFARGLEGQRVSLKLNHLLLEIKQILDQTLPKSIQIQTELDRNLATIEGDPTQLHQVLMNLCVNARDAMPNGGMLLIKAENLAIDESFARRHLDAQIGDYVVVTVADTGVGIPPEHLHRIFDPFFTTKAIGKGTGLGLSALLGIVKSHGGFVDVRSEINQGSQFQIFLPTSQTTTPSFDEDLEARSGHQQLILIVDDEISICETMKETLLAHDYRVLIAHDGTEAIAHLKKHLQEIRYVLLDLMMPTLSGLETLPLLRQLQPNCHAIAMSGLAATEVIEQAEKLGFESFLQKPFTKRDLLAKLGA